MRRSTPHGVPLHGALFAARVGPGKISRTISSPPKAARLHRRSNRQVGFPLRINDEIPIRSLTVACCLDAPNFTAGQVEHPALVSIHGREGVRDATGADLFRRGLGGHAQLLSPQGFEVPGVETYQVVLA